MWLEQGAQQAYQDSATLLSALPLVLMVAFPGLWTVSGWLPEILDEHLSRLKSNSKRNYLFLVIFSTNPKSHSDWTLQDMFLPLN